MHRTSDDERIRFFHFFSNCAAHIVVENASITSVLMAATAVDAHADKLAANLNNLRLHTVFLERRLNLFQTTERVAVGSRTSVDE